MTSGPADDIRFSGEALQRYAAAPARELATPSAYVDLVLGARPVGAIGGGAR